MTRQESVAFLGKMQALAQQYGELLERCMGELKDMDESDLAGATQQVQDVLIRGLVFPQAASAEL